ncbi:uncharacterized protein K460DRAFT_145260 [Cucurbitaria berberidis CBS 394.84]|uniref:Uncharacterized protein n=1 Tax=Cucurbitaria berberidis CBS 394.84 TaxID=1168544 RepID=A0A9P4GD80_9PLEO|nr:uncharacterized protein K460DRAFT_145260 [Cucurbitaria berberidis CBS 394.84]KAF1843435.1 hypothetical protein K460DRAFT_145260 [Cucurbitaria berberidis CBS 394.84]
MWLRDVRYLEIVWSSRDAQLYATVSAYGVAKMCVWRIKVSYAWTMTPLTAFGLRLILGPLVDLALVIALTASVHIRVVKMGKDGLVSYPNITRLYFTKTEMLDSCSASFLLGHNHAIGTPHCDLACSCRLGLSKIRSCT